MTDDPDYRMWHHLVDFAVIALFAFGVSYFCPGSKKLRAFVASLAVVVGLAFLRFVSAHQLNWWKPMFLSSVVLGIAIGTGVAIVLRFKK